jgi:hypothetical protein
MLLIMLINCAPLLTVRLYGPENAIRGSSYRPPAVLRSNKILLPTYILCMRPSH